MKIITALSILLFFTNCFLQGQTLDPAFPTVVGKVNVVKIQGNTLYLGGNFTQVGSVSRKNLAAINLSSKAVMDWAPQPDGDVVDLEVLNGKVYVCGHFTAINSIARNSLAAIDALTGAVDNFSAKITFPGIPGMQTGTVSSIAIVDTFLYVGGYFLKVNNITRSNFAKLGLPAGSLDPLAIPTDIPLNLLEADVTHKVMYLGGPFSTVGSNQRKGFAAIDLQNNTVLPWAPQSDSPGNTITCVAPVGDKVYISGIFFGLNGGSPCFAARTNSAGKADNWAPFACNPISLINAMSVSDSFIVAGGDFPSFAGLSRNSLVKWNRYSDEISSWDPSPIGKVLSLAENGQYLVVAGSFGQIAGQPVSNLAVFNKSSSSGVQNIEVQLLTAFPNPADAQCTIQLPAGAQVETLEAFAIDGKVIALPFEMQGAVLNIQTTSLPAGIYTIRAVSSSGNHYLARLTVHR